MHTRPSRVYAIRAPYRRASESEYDAVAVNRTEAMNAPTSCVPRSPTRGLMLRTGNRTIPLIAKCEFYGPTGSHKDRESRALVREAKMRGKAGVCCASTGNLARSLSYFARLAGIDCHVWLNPGSCSPATRVWLETTGCVCHDADGPLNALYEASNRYASAHRLLNGNPGQSRLKLDANAEIVEELLTQHPRITEVFTAINNGTHALGLVQGIRRSGKDIVVNAAHTQAPLCSSIAGFLRKEDPDALLAAVRDGRLILHKTAQSEILEAGRMMVDAGYHVEPAVWAAVAAAVRSNRLGPGCALILTGAATNKLDEYLAVIGASEVDARAGAATAKITRPASFRSGADEIQRARRPEQR